MRWPDQLRLRVRSLLRRGRVDEELSRELRFHLDQQTDEHIAAGMTPRDARFAALREMGNVLRISEECRDARGLRPLDDLKQDVRYALRTLARNPGFAGVSILTLALGIGLTTGVFSVVSAVLLRPLPYDDADRLVAIVENVPAAENFRGVAMRTSAMNQDEILWWRTHAQTLHVAAATPVRQTIRTADRTVRLSGLRVSPTWFEIYGVQPARGRWLRPDEERPDADVIVISTAMWREFLGSDPRVLERTIVLDARSYRVVGVMPANVFANIAFWLPFFAEPSTPDATTFVSVTSRLRDGVSLEAAAAEVNVLGHQLRGIAQEPDGPARFDVVRVQDQAIARVRPALRILSVAVGAVLIVVCANVANLLLARGASRRREIEIRRALGASRGRIVRQMLTESIVLSVVGGLAGTVIATAGVQLVKPLAVYGLPEAFRSTLGPAVLDRSVLPRIDEVTINGGVFTFVLAIAVVTGVLFGIAPALRLSRVERVAAHADASSTSGRSPRRQHGLGHTLAVSQLVLATTLLVVTVLLARSLVKLSSVDIGFDPGVLTFELVAPGSYSPTQRLALAQRVSDELRSLPTVTAAGFTDRPPFSRMGPSWQGPVVPVEREWRGMDRADMAMIRSVSPDYLRALGVDLVAGRWLENRPEGALPTVVVNRAYARRFFGEQNPVGATLRWGTMGLFQVVGVVEDIWLHLPATLEEEPGHAVFMQPRVAKDAQGGNPSFAVRAVGDPLSIVTDVRRVVRQIDPGLAIDGTTTMDRVLGGLQTRPRFYAVVFAIFGAVAALIALIGIYGVLAYGVTQRTKEIGIRMALGARRGEVLGLVMRQAALLIIVGITMGLLGATWSTRYLATMLFGLTPLDGATYGAVALTFATVAIVASYVPARRATRVDPLVALRYE